MTFVCFMHFDPQDFCGVLPQGFSPDSSATFDIFDLYCIPNPFIIGDDIQIVTIGKKSRDVLQDNRQWILSKVSSSLVETPASPRKKIQECRSGKSLSDGVIGTFQSLVFQWGQTPSKGFF